MDSFYAYFQSEEFIKIKNEYESNEYKSNEYKRNKCKENNKLIVPSINLITDNSNEQFYYERFYDEVIRYDYIRKFIFDTDSYLSLVKQNYNLNETEFILPQSLLNSKYFDNLNEVKGSLNKIYDTAYPQIHIPYNNIHKLIEISKEDNINDNEDEEKIFQVRKEKKKINRCPNGFRRVDGICEPIDKTEWQIISKDDKKIIYKSTTIPDKTIEILI